MASSGPGALPAPAIRALRRLNAPGDLSSVPDAVEWARTGLSFVLTCGSPTGPSGRGTVRHRVQVNPFTGHSLPAPTTPREHTKVETVHFLWGLTHDEPPPCVRAGQVLTEWTGTYHPPRLAPWSVARNAEMLAVRTLMRLVTYTDATDVVMPRARWLALGATVGNLRHLRARLGDHPDDRSGAERHLLEQVNARLGDHLGRPYTGAHPSGPCSADIDTVIDEWQPLLPRS